MQNKFIFLNCRHTKDDIFLLMKWLFQDNYYIYYLFLNQLRWYKELLNVCRITCCYNIK